MELSCDLIASLKVDFQCKINLNTYLYQRILQKYSIPVHFDF